MVFPHARLSSKFMIGSPNVAPSEFNGRISPKNIFKDTVYEYKGDGKFIHFTSLFGLKAILDSGWIRMSEFGNLIDKQELVYGASIFNDNPLFQLKADKQEFLKSTIFCLSACKANEITKHNAYMWEVYADKSKGVMIEFELTKKDIHPFILGNIQYGQEKLNPLRIIKSLAEKFKEDFDGFFPNNFLEIILGIQAFHKSKQFDVEDEARIFMEQQKRPYDDHVYKLIYKDINANQEVKYFNKLFLNVSQPYLTKRTNNKANESDLFNGFPRLEIKSITLGSGITIPNKCALMDLFETKIEYKKYAFSLFQMTNESVISEMK